MLYGALLILKVKELAIQHPDNHSLVAELVPQYIDDLADVGLQGVDVMLRQVQDLLAFVFALNG